MFLFLCFFCLLLSFCSHRSPSPFTFSWQRSTVSCFAREASHLPSHGFSSGAASSSIPNSPRHCSSCRRPCGGYEIRPIHHMAKVILQELPVEIQVPATHRHCQVHAIVGQLFGLPTRIAWRPQSELYTLAPTVFTKASGRHLPTEVGGSCVQLRRSMAGLSRSACYNRFGPNALVQLL